MDAEAAAPLSPVSAPLWRLGERRSRKPASANIFGGVALWQLQRLYQAAGDQDAEQRAQLVWGEGGEGELAQALIGLRARGRRRGLRTRRKSGQMGSRWLKAFHHMRIRESSPNSHGVASNEGNNNNNHNEDQNKNNNEDQNNNKQGDEGHDSDTVRFCSTDPHTLTLAAQEPGAPMSHPQSQGPVIFSHGAQRAGPRLRRGLDSHAERYLHHIIH